MRREEEGCAHIAGQFLIVLHQLLVLLVDRQHFADPVGRRLSLDGEGGRESVRERTKSRHAAQTFSSAALEAAAWSHV